MPLPRPSPATPRASIPAPLDGPATGAQAAGDLVARDYRAGDGPLLARWLLEADLEVPAALADGGLDPRLIGDPHIHCRWIGRPRPGGGIDPIGFFRLDLAPDGEAELAVAVAPEHRRTGVGRELVARAADSVRGRGGRGLVALVRRQNESAIRFFGALGFLAAGPSAAEGFLRFEMAS